MNEKKVNAQYLDQCFPSASDSFKKETMAMLNAVADREEEKPMKRKSLTTILVMALITVLLTATALAMGLNRSSRSTATKTANDAVMQTYGLTMETLGAFRQEVEEKDGGWTITYSPVKFNLDAMGTYTVTIGKDGTAEASWTHDGQPLDGAGLDASIWGQTQLEQVLAVDREHFASRGSIDWDDQENWSIEARAAMDKVLVDSGVTETVVHVAPGPEDIQEDEALAMAKDAIMKTYGIPEEEFEAYDVSFLTFTKSGWEDEPAYSISLEHRELREEKEYGEVPLSSFWVRIFSPSGDVASCSWQVEPEYQTLPEGPLKGYDQAVKEFVEYGAFGLLAPGEKAEVAARIKEAGYGKYIGSKEYVAPKDGDITQEEAVKAAGEALEAAYGVSGSMLDLFDQSVSLLMKNGAPTWTVEYVPTMDSDAPPFEGFAKKMGEYRVLVSPEDGTATATWTKDGVKLDAEAPTKDTWGQAKVWDSTVLPWVAELVNAQQEMEKAAFAADDTWSLTYLAGHDALFLGAGFDSDSYKHILPGKGDLSEAEAWEVMRMVLAEDYGVTGEVLETMSYLPEFYTADGQHIWDFRMQRTGDEGYQDWYQIRMDAQTSEIISMDYIAAGNG